MKRRQPIPSRYVPPSAIKGEKDSEIGRRIEKGQPATSYRMQAGKPADAQSEDLRNKIEDLEQKDRAETEEEIKQLRNFLNEVAEEGRKRQAEMRKRVEEIVEEKLQQQEDSTPGDSLRKTPGVLVEPSTKAKRGSFMARLKKKGKGAMAEARGSIAKGGG